MTCISQKSNKANTLHTFVQVVCIPRARGGGPPCAYARSFRGHAHDDLSSSCGWHAWPSITTLLHVPCKGRNTRRERLVRARVCVDQFLAVNRSSMCHGHEPRSNQCQMLLMHTPET
jgi:hypothetical protein